MFQIVLSRVGYRHQLLFIEWQPVYSSADIYYKSFSKSITKLEVQPKKRTKSHLFYFSQNSHDIAIETLKCVSKGQVKICHG